MELDRFCDFLNKRLLEAQENSANYILNNTGIDSDLLLARQAGAHAMLKELREKFPALLEEFKRVYFR